MNLGKRARMVPQRRVSGEISYLSSIRSKNQAWLFMIKLSSHFLAPRIDKWTGKINVIKFGGVLKTGQQSWSVQHLAVRPALGSNTFHQLYVRPGINRDPQETFIRYSYQLLLTDRHRFIAGIAVGNVVRRSTLSKWLD